MAKKRKRSSGGRRSGGGLGKFTPFLEAGMYGAGLGWIEKQDFVANLPTIAGSKRITLALVGAFLSGQGGMLGKHAGKIGLAAATLAGNNLGRGEDISGDEAFVGDRLRRLRNRAERRLAEREDAPVEGAFTGTREGAGV
jgi:hypothetical protein